MDGTKLTYVVHCADPIEPGTVDSAFRDEAAVAEAAGLVSLRIDHDALVAGDMRRATGKARRSDPGSAVYRGWMMTQEAYARLYVSLAGTGIVLITPPEAYADCHHLPLAHASVGGFMPETSWVTEDAMDGPAALREALDRFGTAPVTVKDWVKSQAAGYWDTACLIPDASDRGAVARITGRFRELQGGDLVGGLVFRRLVDLSRAGDDVVEWRGFFVDGVAVGCWPRFRGDGHAAPPGTLLADIGRLLPSPFATADLAQGVDGRWWLMETGDGQVSGFPDGAAEAVLGALASRVPDPYQPAMPYTRSGP